jgi:lipoprotein-anchoring transpeptidase ErfK/SrfK
MTRSWRLRGAYVLLLLGIAALGFLLPTLLAERGGGQAGANGSKTAPAVAAGHTYQELAALTAAHDVYSGPAGRAFERISSTRPITGEQTVLPVMRAASSGGAEWLQVRLPGRPNGLTGWIEQSGTKLEYTSWRISVDLSKRRVYAYDRNRMVRSFEALVGAPATPTPRGEFFVEENVALAPSAVGYPYALALSSRSNVIQEFAGGPGQIALHGVDNVGGTLGTAVSHGCIRLDTADITWLAKHVDTGVPVNVY